jgi:hypothetical protein
MLTHVINSHLKVLKRGLQVDFEKIFYSFESADCLRSVKFKLHRQYVASETTWGRKKGEEIKQNKLYKKL